MVLNLPNAKVDMFLVVYGDSDRTSLIKSSSRSPALKGWVSRWIELACRLGRDPHHSLAKWWEQNMFLNLNLIHLPGSPITQKWTCLVLYDVL